MSELSPHGGSPVRIELATSEIDGGNCVAWADPGQVLALVALSQPEDTFARMVEPRLSELDAPAEEEEFPELKDEAGGPEVADSLPPTVRTLAKRLQAVHRRLCHDNRSLHRDMRCVEVTCALAEEDRIYLIKGGSAWICLLREGRAYAAEANAPRLEVGRPALGAKDNLRLEVSSLPVLPGDTVVLLTAATDVPVDTGAVAHLFSQTPDLKRACDGLVNLLGLQAQGASAVALRFTPIACRVEDFKRENPLLNISSEWVAGEPEPEDAPIEAMLDRAFPHTTPISPSPAREVRDPWVRRNTPAPADPAPLSGSPAASSNSLAHASARKSAMTERLRRAARSDEMNPPGGPHGDDVLPGRSQGLIQALKRRLRSWPFLLTLALLVSLAAVALPQARHGHGWKGLSALFHPPAAGPGKGTILVEPDPPARKVLLDGQEAGEETPTRLEGVLAGKHTIGLDLGPCGIWESEIKLETDATVRVAPKLKGSVEISAADPATGGKVWMEGRAKMPVPATLDSLPVGWNRLFYEDDRLPMWDRQVLVRAGQVAQVVVPNNFSSDQGMVKVESLTFKERQGMLDSEGDTVYVDGQKSGLTPWQASLRPGLHSVRVNGTDGTSYCEVLDVHAGAARNVSALLGQGPRPSFHHVSPGRVVVKGPVLLSVEISGADPGPQLHPTLHLPELPPGSREVPLTSVNEGQGMYVGAIDPDALPPGQTVSYYFSLIDAQGEIISSDLYHFLPMRGGDSAGRDAPEEAPVQSVSGGQVNAAP